MDCEFGNGFAFSPFMTDVDGAPYARREIRGAVDAGR